MSTDYPHISTDPAVNDGRASITGTLTRVTEVAAAIEAGRKPADLLARFASRELTLGEVYSALAYYHDNRDSLAVIDAEDKRVADGIEHARLEHIKRYFLGLEDSLPPKK